MKPINKATLGIVSESPGRNASELTGGLEKNSIGNKEKTEEHYRAAVKLNPTQFPDAYYNYGILLMKEGKIEEAEKAFRKALDICPT
jgi:tetratricopeptide (TPR) repeat protein